VEWLARARLVDVTHCKGLGNAAALSGRQRAPADGKGLPGWQTLAAACGKLTPHKALTPGGIAAMSAFQREILVRFGHCDAAGWVFYPRYFEMISDFVEDWFEDGLAASAPGLFHHKQILTPSVHFTVDFVKPTRYGDRLTFFLWTTKIGTSSVELRIEASHQGELRMRVKQVLVFISAHTSRSTPIPPELVSRMHRFQVDDASVPAPAAEDAPAKSRKRKSPVAP
jgi:4-hydroxybenzoyl-CoA thioesterase